MIGHVVPNTGQRPEMQCDGTLSNTCYTSTTTWAVNLWARHVCLLPRGLATLPVGQISSTLKAARTLLFHPSLDGSIIVSLVLRTALDKGPLKRCLINIFPTETKSCSLIPCFKNALKYFTEERRKNGLPVI